MNKEELALELTKIISEKIVSGLAYTESSRNPEKALVDAYNYIYENIKFSEQ